MRNAYLKRVKRIVIKVGTSSITHPTGLIDLSRLDRLVRQISNLQNAGYEVILVSSGAIGAGMGKLNLTERPKTIPEKQAAAAVGQVALTHMYQKMFSEYGKVVGQILLTKDDIGDRHRFLMARDAFFSLLKQKVIPIVNENDAVVVDEIKVGDNDTLSALVGSLVDTDLLIILSDIDGLYDKNPKSNPDAKLIEEVTEVTDDIRASASGVGSSLGTGGMITKLNAADIIQDQGAGMIIACGETPDVLNRIMNLELIGTFFAPKELKLSMKKHWMKYGSKSAGVIIVDDGAKKALTLGKSLLAVGIKALEGHFNQGDIVTIKTESGEEVATGVTYYDAYHLEQIMGKSSYEIESVLGFKDYDVVIHANHMSIRG